MSSLFIAVLNMSLTASYVALVVIVVRFLLRKAPKIFSYCLWVAVLFRLVVPYSFQSRFSLLQLQVDTVPQDLANSQVPVVNSGIQFMDSMIARTVQSSLLPEAGANINPLQIATEIVAAVWIFGIIVLLLYAALSYFKLKQRVSEAAAVKDRVLETNLIQTPFVLGFIKPSVYIPKGLKETEIDHILKHEQTHIRRGDHIIKPLAFLAVVLHWFNPFMWYCYFLVTKDMEMSCDESVMSQAGEDIRASYSHSLLSLTIRQSALLTPLAFGESSIKSRIKNVLNYKKPTLWVIIIAVMVLVAALTGLSSNPIKEAGSDYRSAGNKTSSNELIYDLELIDEINIDVAVVPEKTNYSNTVLDEGEFYRVINNEAQVNEIVNLLLNIKVDQVSLEKGLNVNEEDWAQKLKYSIVLLASSEYEDSGLTVPGSAVKGGITVLEEDYLFFIDQTTMGSDEPDYYISSDKQTAVIERIEQVLDKQTEVIEIEQVIDKQIEDIEVDQVTIETEAMERIKQVTNESNNMQ